MAHRNKPTRARMLLPKSASKSHIPLAQNRQPFSNARLDCRRATSPLQPGYARLSFADAAIRADSEYSNRAPSQMSRSSTPSSRPPRNYLVPHTGLSSPHTTRSLPSAASTPIMTASTSASCCACALRVHRSNPSSRRGRTTTIQMEVRLAMKTRQARRRCMDASHHCLGTWEYSSRSTSKARALKRLPDGSMSTISENWEERWRRKTQPLRRTTSLCQHQGRGVRVSTIPTMTGRGIWGHGRKKTEMISCPVDTRESAHRPGGPDRQVRCRIPAHGARE